MSANVAAVHGLTSATPDGVILVMSAMAPVNVNHVLVLFNPALRACHWLSCLVHVGRFVMSNVALVSAEFPGIVRPARLVAAVGFAVVIG